MPQIKLKELYAYYGKGKNENLVIEEMTETFNSNKISVIVGPSGCGKTTLLRALLGIIEYDGDIYFDDVDIYEVSTDKRNMAYVNQDVSLFSHLTVFENIIFPLKSKKLSREKILRKTREISKKLGISHCLNVKPKYLSLGQQQRVLLAREIVSEPSILLLDEPVSHLDKALKEEILHLIKQMCKEQNLTVIYVTHSLSEAVFIGDEIFVMEKGKFIVKGSPNEIFMSNNEFIKMMKKSEMYEKDK